jgi:hypothetical protein
MSARPFYPHEADDPDLDWLVSNFLYERPQYIPVETGMLPLILLPFNEELKEPQVKKLVGAESEKLTDPQTFLNRGRE